MEKYPMETAQVGEVFEVTEVVPPKEEDPSLDPFGLDLGIIMYSHG